MDLMQPAGSGLWGHTNPTGELIQVFHHHLPDGISDSNLKGYHLVLMMVFNFMGLLHQQIAKKVVIGGEVIIMLITNIWYLMELAHISVVRSISFLNSSRLSRQYRKSGPTTLVIQEEGTSTGRDFGGSTSSRSDSSDYDSIAKSHSSHHNFSRRRCFMSKAIHPLSFPSETPTRPTDDTAVRLPEFDAINLRKDKSHLSSASSSLDLADISEPLESDLSCTSCNPPDKFRCGLCERFLSQISPWSSRWIIRSVDMPVAAVLSCRHVFHAECLEQTAPKVPKSDPPCPNCFKFE
ncbi:uncharacterized protein LOC111395836 isoform X3 [Olea europaea var. sylvestris]|nr:uncharacterized protein LOC111395836 isoform X3 [Olea europaea var. sylvestris]